MKNIGNIAPGGRQKENPNEHIVSLWEKALRVARRENSVIRLKAQQVPSVILQDHENLEKSARKEMPKEAERFLAAAQSYEERVEARRKFVAESFIKKMEDTIEEKGENDPIALENEELIEEGEIPEEFDFGYDNPKKAIINFFERVDERARTKEYVSVIRALHIVLMIIRQEIEVTKFYPTQDTEARQNDIKNIKCLSFFISMLERELRSAGSSTSVEKIDDPIKRVIESLDKNPIELLRALLAVLKKVTEDLETSKFPPLPEEPTEVTTARNNLLRGKRAIN